MVLFGARYNFEAPEGLHVGPAFVAMVAVVPLSLLNAKLSGWINDVQKCEYERIY